MPSTPEDRLDRLLTLGPRLYDLKEPSGRATSLVDALLASAPAGDGAARRVDKLLEAAGEDSDAMTKTANNLPQLDDAIDHWREARERVDACRAALADAQLAVRGAASLEEGEVAAEALAAAAAARNEARVSLIDELDEALALHKRWDAEGQRGRLQAEAARLAEAAAADSPGALGAALTRRLRLERLQAQLLPILDEWLGRVAGWRAEVDALRPHRAGAPPSLEELHRLREALKKAKRAARDAGRALEDVKEDGDDPADALTALKAARRRVQANERALHAERTQLARTASVHFPELLSNERALLTLSTAVDGEALGALLAPAARHREQPWPAAQVERELEAYDREEKTLSARGARHKVWRASYDGETCALKEYELADPAEWKALVKEVRLLSELAHPHIASIEAVFMQQSPLVAYIQLPYYAGGDMLCWLGAADREPWRRKELLGQLCEALRHVHSHGVAHGDVKLENVLVSISGEHATAHLADFESARAQPAGTVSLSSTGGGSAFTELYVAPEILAASKEGRPAKPTAAGDMFSYGVCCLFACCLPPSAEARLADVRRFVADGRKLAGWSRQNAKQADPHLAGLLDELLAEAATDEEAIPLRPSASEALLRPFHSTAAAREAAAAVQAEAAAASHEAAEQLAAVNRDAARKRREAEWREAEQRRKQAEEEQKLERAAEEARLEAEAQKADIEGRQRRLAAQQRAFKEQEAAAKRAEAEAAKAEAKEAAARQAAKEAAAALAAKAAEQKKKLEAEEARVKAEVDKKKAELRAKEEKVKEEQAKLEKLQAQKRLPPSYWQRKIAEGSKDGFALLPIDRQSGTWSALQQLLVTRGDWLGKGRDAKPGAPYNQLRLATAWRIEHPTLWGSYMAGRDKMGEQMKRLKGAGKLHGPQPVKTALAAGALPGQLRPDVNESYLLHGAPPSAILSILATGANERFSGSNAGTAFGDGSYFAEDAGKNDQYVSLDHQHNSSDELHKRLYAHAKHEGKVGYILVCRVMLGQSVRTQTNGPGMRSMDGGYPIFPIGFRELCTVSGVSPPVFYHSLIAEIGGVIDRYREFIVFHGEYIYPEYVIAYQRFNNGHGPVG